MKVWSKANSKIRNGETTKRIEMSKNEDDNKVYDVVEEMPQFLNRIEYNNNIKLYSYEYK